MAHRIAVLVGSLRAESLNRKIAMALKRLAAGRLDLELVDLSDLQMYNPDLDDEGPVPAGWTQFREHVKSAEGVLFVTPEYNRSVPACLKNALDVGSRPYGKSVWSGKPGGVISASPGAIGGFGANHHLRQSLVFLDVPCLQQPEAYLGHAGQMIAADGKLTDGHGADLLLKFVDAYEQWVTTNVRKPKV